MQNDKYKHNEYAIDNKYMTDEILISNALAFIRGNIKIPDLKLKTLPAIGKKAEGEATTTPVDEDAVEMSEEEFQRLYKISRCMGDHYDTLKEVASKALLVIASIKNDDNLLTYMTEWGFNPGVAIVYVRTVACETDSLMISRPGGAHLITAPHELDKRADLNDMADIIRFNMKQRHGHTICGLGNTSVKLCGAYNVQRIGAESSEVINPLHEETADALELGPQITDFCGNVIPDQQPKWWPVLWNPNVTRGFFDGPCSPLGRSPVPFESLEDFENNFWNDNRKDVQFRNIFSINHLFDKYGPNSFGYLPSLKRNPRCPLTKYITFSTDRRVNVAEAQTHQLRLRQITTGGLASDGSRLDMSMPIYKCANNLSDSCGAAIVKRCYTHQDLLGDNDQHRFSSIYPGAHVIQNERKYGHNFFYLGNDAFEIFDIGVPYSGVS